VVLMRVDLANPGLKAARLFAAIERYDEALFGRYTVIEEARIRSRPLREMPAR